MTQNTRYLGNIQTPYFSKDDVKTLNEWYSILPERVQEALWMERDTYHFATNLTLCGLMVEAKEDPLLAAKASYFFPKNGIVFTPNDPGEFGTCFYRAQQKGIRPIETLCKIAQRDFPEHNDTHRLMDFVENVEAIRRKNLF